MHYRALATDYDGTLARDGVVAESTIKALECLRNPNRKLILVTGRELPDLERIFCRLDLFDRVVAENGALLYNPASRESRNLAASPSAEFVESLRRSGIPDMSVGRVIIALRRPYEHEAAEAIRNSGLRLQLIFNKDSVMILPSEVNKMTGLSAALKDLSISRQNVIGIGDAENDLEFLRGCGCAVAVGNAIPPLKNEADFVTHAACGEGVVELIGRLIENDPGENHRTG